MKLEELLKDSPEVLKAVTDAIAKANEGQEDKLKHIRFADLSEGGYVSKDKYTSLETDLTGKTSELEKANSLIEELKKGTSKDEALQQKITDYEQQISDLQAENSALKVDNALKFALSQAGGSDIDYLMFKAKEKGEIKLDDNDEIKGLNELIAGLKTQHPVMFGSSNGNTQNTDKNILVNKLPSGSTDKNVTKDQFLKMGYNERMKLKQENPELFKQLNVH